MLVAHRIALDPNQAQATYFSRAAGTARFAYNWALAEWKQQACAWWESGKVLPFPSEISLRKQFNAIKREQFPWALEVTKLAPQNAIIDLGIAFRNYKNANHPAQYPKFKSKSSTTPSFVAADEPHTFKCEGKRVKLPIIGWVRMREPLRFNGIAKKVTVSKTAGRWFASIVVDTVIEHVARPEVVRTVGVDLGIRTFAALSVNGKVEKIEGPKAHKKALARLRRANKALARKQRGSANFRKAKARLARVHARVANIRRDAQHKLSHLLTTRYDRIGIEDLNVKGMVKNRHLARSISDAGWSQFRLMLEYKAKMYGAVVVQADRFFPSTKTCSSCGFVLKEIGQGVEHWTCLSCGTAHDRDGNAAINLEKMAASFAVSACGERRADAERKPRVKRRSVKQEEGVSPTGKAA